MTCAHNDEGGGWRKALDEDIIGLRAGLAFDRVGARDCLAVPDGAFGVRSHQCIERVIAQTALCAPTGKHQQLVPDGISAAHNRRHRYTFLLVQHCLQRFKKLTHRRFPLWMPLNASIHAHQSRRSTKTWIVPPQARPICSIFSSSVMPNSSICGLPSSITSIAASTTAGSTQPPLTEPDSSPLSLTASFAPGWRGAEPAILTTVAMATRSPRARQRSMSGNTSRMINKTSCVCASVFLPLAARARPAGKEKTLALYPGLAPPGNGFAARRRVAYRAALVNVAQQVAQVNQTVQVMSRQKVIDIGQGRLHTNGQRAIIGRAKQRIEPDEPVTAMLQTVHLDLQHTGIAAIPAIADNQHNSAATQHALRPSMVKVVQGIADARATGPVLHRLRNVAHSIIDIAPLELAGNARQAGAEDEGFNIHQTVGDGVYKVQQQPRVKAHGAADVADDDERARLTFGLAPRQFK